MALLFNLKGNFYEDTSITFFLLFFFKQIRKGFLVCVFKDSTYILVGNFFFLAEDFIWISFLN